MVKTKHEFLLDLFITEGFNVITREGLSVTYGWSNGTFSHDLFLIMQ